MMEIMCECDWGLGVPLPWHTHLHLVRTELDGGGRGPIWMNHFLGASGDRSWNVTMEVDELRFHVPWKDLWREHGV
jgi:hypothetical protein